MAVKHPPSEPTTLAAWVAVVVVTGDPVALADAAAAIGAALVLGPSAEDAGHGLGTALVRSAELAIPTDACCRASWCAGGLAALRELIAGHDDARRTGSGGPKAAASSLDERLVDALAGHGPMRRADLARALDTAPSTVTAALARLARRGMVQTTTSHAPRGRSKPGGRPVVAYALTPAGTAAASLP
ncbi:MAG: MarR family transcriptional regulator [Acidimicrobiales bacterium]|nr:MarR family transcriptional regulator [Actinomycetota bacterium]